MCPAASIELLSYVDGGLRAGRPTTPQATFPKPCRGRCPHAREAKRSKYPWGIAPPYTEAFSYVARADVPQGDFRWACASAPTFSLMKYAQTMHAVFDDLHEEFPKIVCRYE